MDYIEKLIDEKVRLERKISDNEIANKNKIIKAKKINRRGILKLIGSIVIVPASVLTLSSFSSKNPFKYEKNKVYPVEVVSMDENGNTTLEAEAYTLNGTYCEVSYYGAWKQTRNGNYERKVNTLYIKYSENVVKEIIKLAREYDKISYSQLVELVKPLLKEENNSFTKVERTSSLSKDEFNKSNYITATFNSTNYNEVRYITETKEENYYDILNVLSYIAFLMFFEFLYLTIITMYYNDKSKIVQIIDEIKYKPKLKSDKKYQEQLDATLEKISYYELNKYDVDIPEYEVVDATSEDLEEGLGRTMK